jgi:hypothetical protein
MYYSTLYVYDITFFNSINDILLPSLLTEKSFSMIRVILNVLCLIAYKRNVFSIKRRSVKNRILKKHDEF